MLPPEVLAKIQRFHFRTRKLASEIFAGQYESAFRGQGIEFAEVREYQVGDDIRSIDWNVSARFGRPFVKVFHEERELTIMLLIDLSGSHLFGSRTRFKRELLAEVAGMLAFLAIRTNDRVGAVLFSSGVEKFLPPRKGPRHVWRLIREIFTFEPENRGTNIDAALEFLNRTTRRHAVVFLISDCLDTGFGKSLSLAAKKHDLTVIRIFDPAEETLPDAGIVTLKDPETGKVARVDTSGPRVRKLYEEWGRARREDLIRMLSGTGVDLVEIGTPGPVVEPLLRLFNRRRRRLHA
ncbi:MAG TPA: DUF58 domain-containing protein [Deltaproteobacteria bacterium]|nr:DUF58 domain-containing protein [Deltaproteobacteria bacterium]HOI05995.1 DUF58 domain-containing protein [Deltaproteobacteria bacterium]